MKELAAAFTFNTFTLDEMMSALANFNFGDNLTIMIFIITLISLDFISLLCLGWFRGHRKRQLRRREDRMYDKEVIILEVMEMERRKKQLIKAAAQEQMAQKAEEKQYTRNAWGKQKMSAKNAAGKHPGVFESDKLEQSLATAPPSPPPSPPLEQSPSQRIRGQLLQQVQARRVAEQSALAALSPQPAMGNVVDDAVSRVNRRRRFSRFVAGRHGMWEDESNEYTVQKPEESRLSTGRIGVDLFQGPFDKPVIDRVLRKSAAHKAGLRSGLVILEINEHVPRNAREAARMLARAEGEIVIKACPSANLTGQVMRAMPAGMRKSVRNLGAKLDENLSTKEGRKALGEKMHREFFAWIGRLCELARSEHTVINLVAPPDEEDALTPDQVIHMFFSAIALELAIICFQTPTPATRDGQPDYDKRKSPEEIKMLREATLTVREASTTPCVDSEGMQTAELRTSSRAA